MSPKNSHNSGSSQGNGEEKHPILEEPCFVTLNAKYANVPTGEQFEQVLNRVFQQFPKASVFFGPEYPKAFVDKFISHANKGTGGDWKTMKHPPPNCDPMLFYDANLWKEIPIENNEVQPPRESKHDNCRPRMVMLESTKCRGVKFLAVPVHGPGPRKSVDILKGYFEKLLRDLIEYSAKSGVTVVMGGDFNLAATDYFEEIITDLGMAGKMGKQVEVHTPHDRRKTGRADKSSIDYFVTIKNSQKKKAEDVRPPDLKFKPKDSIDGIKMGTVPQNFGGTRKLGHEPVGLVYNLDQGCQINQLRTRADESDKKIDRLENEMRELKAQLEKLRNVVETANQQEGVAGPSGIAPVLSDNYTKRKLAEDNVKKKLKEKSATGKGKTKDDKGKGPANEGDVEQEDEEVVEDVEEEEAANKHQVPISGLVEVFSRDPPLQGHLTFSNEEKTKGMITVTSEGEYKNQTFKTSRWVKDVLGKSSGWKDVTFLRDEDGNEMTIKKYLNEAPEQQVEIFTDEIDTLGGNTQDPPEAPKKSKAKRIRKDKAPVASGPTNDDDDDDEARAVIPPSFQPGRFNTEKEDCTLKVFRKQLLMRLPESNVDKLLKSADIRIMKSGINEHAYFEEGCELIGMENIVSEFLRMFPSKTPGRRSRQGTTNQWVNMPLPPPNRGEDASPSVEQQKIRLGHEIADNEGNAQEDEDPQAVVGTPGSNPTEADILCKYCQKHLGRDGEHEMKDCPHRWYIKRQPILDIAGVDPEIYAKDYPEQIQKYVKGPWQDLQTIIERGASRGKSKVQSHIDIIKDAIDVRCKQVDTDEGLMKALDVSNWEIASLGRNKDPAEYDFKYYSPAGQSYRSLKDVTRSLESKESKEAPNGTPAIPGQRQTKLPLRYQSDYDVGHTNKVRNGAELNAEEAEAEGEHEGEDGQEREQYEDSDNEDGDAEDCDDSEVIDLT